MAVDVPFDPDLGGELVQVSAVLGGLRGEGVDVDGLHGAVQLGDLLLQSHRRDQARARSRGGRVVSSQGVVMVVAFRVLRCR